MKCMAPLLVALALVVLQVAPLLGAEVYPIWDWSHRAQVSASSGFLAFNHNADVGGQPTWRGLDVAGSLTYSLHPRLSLFAAYAHGFPFKASDGQEDQAKLSANLLLYPEEGAPPTAWRLFAGAGGLWRGSATVKNWSGAEAHATLAASINEWLAAFGSYAHGFASRPDQYSDIDFVRAGLTARVGR